MHSVMLMMTTAVIVVVEREARMHSQGHLTWVLGIQHVGQLPMVDAEGWGCSPGPPRLCHPGCQHVFVHLSRLVSAKLSWQEGCYLLGHFPSCMVGIEWCIYVIFMAFTILVELFNMHDVAVAFCWLCGGWSASMGDGDGRVFTLHPCE